MIAYVREMSDGIFAKKGPKSLFLNYSYLVEVEGEWFGYSFQHGVKTK